MIMNLKDFLIDNYVYIVIVIILIIVTIIGFLADKKKNGGSKKKDDNGQVDSTLQVNNDAASMNYQPVNNQLPNNNLNYVPNQGINQNGNNNGLSMDSNFGAGSVPTPMSNGVNAMANNMNMASPQPAPFGNASAPMPVEPINNVVSNPEPMYQPLSEQKPTFTNNEVNVNQVSPAPIPVTSAIPSVGENNSVGVNQNNGFIEPMAPINGGGIVQNQGMAAVNGGAPSINTQVTNEMAPNQSMGTIPQLIPNTNGNVNPQPVPNPTAVVPNPVNFVYGGQQINNNQNM